MLSLILAESALELVPKELQDHNSVLAYSKKMGKKPSKVILDISWHFAAMRGIKNEIKRGRPDLVHFCLLECCTIPLYFERKLHVYVHTIDDKVIFVGDNVRLPKSYHRFIGLIEKLYSERKIELDSKKLLEIKDMTFSDLVDKIGAKKVIGFSTKGQTSSYDKIAADVGRDSCIVVGGFSKGHFSDKILKKIDNLVSVDRNTLEAHVVISRLLYECEKRIIM
ncbi:MAG TPA: ribosome biogenesis protein [Nitrosopumilaceae archaeon]|nr:ribosome biogenesis protein [Nitrosopumilaceae archaeon]